MLKKQRTLLLGCTAFGTLLLGVVEAGATGWPRLRDPDIRVSSDNDNRNHNRNDIDNRNHNRNDNRNSNANNNSNRNSNANSNSNQNSNSNRNHNSSRSDARSASNSASSSRSNASADNRLHNRVSNDTRLSDVGNSRSHSRTDLTDVGNSRSNSRTDLTDVGNSRSQSRSSSDLSNVGNASSRAHLSNSGNSTASLSDTGNSSISDSGNATVRHAGNSSLRDSGNATLSGSGNSRNSNAFSNDGSGNSDNTNSLSNDGSGNSENANTLSNDGSGNSTNSLSNDGSGNSTNDVNVGTGNSTNDFTNAGANDNSTTINGGDTNVNAIALDYDAIDLATLPVAVCQGSSVTASGSGNDGLFGVGLGFGKSNIDEQCTLRENIRAVATLAEYVPSLRQDVVKAVAYLDGFEHMWSQEQHPKCPQWIKRGSKKARKHNCQLPLMQQQASLQPVGPKPLAAQEYIVLFDFDESTITPEGRRAINQAATRIVQSGVRSVSIGAHTDRAGSVAYNEKLAMRRAESVKAALLQAGVPNDLIMTTSFGEREPRIPTGDGVADLLNRRANVIISFDCSDNGSCQ